MGMSEKTVENHVLDIMRDLAWLQTELEEKDATIARLEAAVIENWVNYGDTGDSWDCQFCGHRFEAKTYDIKSKPLDVIGTHSPDCIYLEALERQKKRQADIDYNNIKTVQTNINKDGDITGEMETVSKEESAQRTRLWLST